MKTLFYSALMIFIFISSALSQVSFIDMSDELNITELDFSCGVGIVDLNNDGISEIIITNHINPDRLYMWQDSIYVELGQVYGLSQTSQHHHTIAITDVDKDYLPDLYITGDPYTNIGELYINHGHPPFQEMAESYNLRDVDDMGSAFFQFTPESELAVLKGGDLMVRTGQTFIDITEGSGFESITNVHTVLIFDIDGDYDDDIFIVGNWYSNSGRLFRNNSDTTFTDISTNTNEGGFPIGQGVCFGDIDNDNDYDIYIVGGDYSSMWANDGTGYFTNVTAQSGTGYGGYIRGSCFGDFDNDGDIDIFLNRALSYNMLLLNDGNGVFEDYSSEAGVLDNYNAFGCATSDLDNDGQLDIVAVNALTGGGPLEPTQVYINQNQNDSFLKVKVVGLYPNTLALGADLELYGYDDDSTEYVYIGKRQIVSVSSMYSFDDPIAHFGTGDYELLKVVVTFNSLHVVDTCGITPGQLITIMEDSTHVSIEEPPNQLPDKYLTLEAYPNPFNSSLQLTISGGTESEYTIEIFDILGRLIKPDYLKTDNLNSANYTWNADDNNGKPVPSGLYFIRVANGQYKAYVKVILLK